VRGETSGASAETRLQSERMQDVQRMEACKSRTAAPFRSAERDATQPVVRLMSWIAS